MDRRSTLKKRRQDQVREEILDATRRVLLSRGLAGMTLTAVARELELTKAALYHYFASKEALVSELIYLSLASHAEVVGDAVASTTSGAAAIEALIRAAADHYGSRKDELRLAYLVPQVGTAAATRFGPDMLARIRPFNDRMYGAVADKIRQDQQAGRVSQSIDGRRVPRPHLRVGHAHRRGSRRDRRRGPPHPPTRRDGGGISAHLYGAACHA
jgi:AcrR family transcriptional regulator